MTPRASAADARRRARRRIARGLAAAIAMSPLAAARTANVTVRDWGSVDGRPVKLFTLRGASGIEASITDYGCRIVALRVPNRAGGRTDVELGYDSFESYRHNGSFGALIGRFVGRISHGGTMPLGGRVYQLDKAQPEAAFVIHGGSAPFAHKLFAAHVHDGREPSLVLTTVSPDGDGGFPGRVEVTVTYTLTAAGALRIDHRARSDRPTWVNLTNHSYFALQGAGDGDIADQTLQVFADRYMPADGGDLVTGEILPVDGSPMDLRRPTRLGDLLRASHPQIALRHGVELSFVVNGTPGTLRPAARLYEPKTGIAMDVATTAPTMVAWSDNVGERTEVGKDGKVYRNAYAISLETQGYLDAPNQPSFPQPLVTPHRPLHDVTVFRFSTPADPTRPAR